MKTIVECVPNFSEGRDRKVIDQIVTSIQSVPGLCVMDLEMDPDHHRSVITFVGEKDKVGEGALRAIAKASELIDLTKHSGAHPRLGATDVVPFIPVHKVTLDECIAIARQVGEEIYRRLAIPVYLYEAAATRPDRIQLENIRRGQFEGLREEIGNSPDRLPDFGKPQVHPTAGATVVGARKFLIAYNINLNTAHVEIAKQIAKTIRFSSGGMPFVKAMGVDLKARRLAQVSMNLTDFEETPVHHVFEGVKHEAERRGVTIAGSEIVGLIPQKAIDMSAEFYLQVENFRSGMIFENRLSEILESPKDLVLTKVIDYVDAVAKTESVPGGGSVSALAGALAAALGKMVVGLTLNRKKYEAYQAGLQDHLRKLESVLSDLTLAVDLDSQAYAQVVAAQQMPKITHDEKRLREEKLQHALKRATEIPLSVSEKAYVVLQSLQELRGISNPNVASDLNVGVWMALAAAQGALDNVRVNLSYIHDLEFVEQQTRRSQELKMLLKEAMAALP